MFSGAGISAESGIKTFRDSDGLWENHDIMKVTTPEAWAKNPSLVLEFYNQRRKDIHRISPNKAHTIIAELEKHFDVSVVNFAHILFGLEKKSLQWKKLQKL